MQRCFVSDVFGAPLMLAQDDGELSDMEAKAPFESDRSMALRTTKVCRLEDEKRKAVGEFFERMRNEAIKKGLRRDPFLLFGSACWARTRRIRWICAMINGRR